MLDYKLGVDKPALCYGPLRCRNKIIGKVCITGTNRVGGPYRYEDVIGLRDTSYSYKAGAVLKMSLGPCFLGQFISHVCWSRVQKGQCTRQVLASAQGRAGAMEQRRRRRIASGSIITRRGSERAMSTCTRSSTCKVTRLAHKIILLARVVSSAEFTYRVGQESVI